MRFDLAIGLHPEHPCHEEERSSTSSRPTTFDLAGRRASPSLSARLGRGVKMPRLRFYNQRSRHEHSISTPLLETACHLPAGCPAGSRLRDRLPEILVRCRHLAFQDPAPDRLSVIRPPAAMRLTAHLPASVRSTAAWTLARPSGELRRFFGSPDALSIRPSDTSFSSLPSARSPREEVGPLSGRLILARRGTSMPAADPRSRRLPSYGTDPGALARSLFGALLRLAGRCSFRAFSPLC
jgi:hypothetical protein